MKWYWNSTSCSTSDLWLFLYSLHFWTIFTRKKNKSPLIFQFEGKWLLSASLGGDGKKSPPCVFFFLSAKDILLKERLCINFLNSNYKGGLRSLSGVWLRVRVWSPVLRWDLLSSPASSPSLSSYYSVTLPLSSPCSFPLSLISIL